MAAIAAQKPNIVSMYYIGLCCTKPSIVSMYDIDLCCIKPKIVSMYIILVYAGHQIQLAMIYNRSYEWSCYLGAFGAQKQVGKIANQISESDIFGFNHSYSRYIKWKTVTYQGCACS